MNDSEAMMTFTLRASQDEQKLSQVTAKNVVQRIDTSIAGLPDALNPVELLLASLSACMIKGVERVAATIGLEYTGLEVTFVAHRPTDEARIDDITYRLEVETSADQSKLDLLHKNLMKFGTIFNTVKSGTRLTGEVVAR